MLDGLDVGQLERVLNLIFGAGAVAMLAAAALFACIAFLITAVARLRQRNTKSEVVILAETINASMATNNTILREINDKLEKTIEIDASRNRMMISQGESLANLAKLTQENVEELKRRNAFVEKFAVQLADNTKLLTDARDTLSLRIGETTEQVRIQSENIMELSGGIKDGIAKLEERFEVELGKVTRELQTISTQLGEVVSNQQAALSATQLKANFETVSKQLDDMTRRVETLMIELKGEIAARIVPVALPEPPVAMIEAGTPEPGESSAQAEISNVKVDVKEEGKTDGSANA